MRFKYDTERQENMIKQSKLDVMQKEQRIQQQTFILIIIFIVLGLLYYLYQRKNKLYVSIVKQNQEAIKEKQNWTDVSENWNKTESPVMLPKNMPDHHSPMRKVWNFSEL